MNDGEKDGSDCIRQLTDLPEELLLRVLAALPNASALLRLSRTSKALSQLAATDMLWKDRIKRELGVIENIEESAPGLAQARFQSFYTLRQLCWRPLEMKDSCSARLLLASGSAGQRPLFRTGSATCQLGDTTLVFGGTLGGNRGPFLDDLYAVDYNRGILFNVKIYNVLTNYVWRVTNRIVSYVCVCD
jgi:hypothetical protein